MKKRTAAKDPSFEVFGMLLYARTREAQHPDNAYSFMGAKISVKTLDLNTDFKNIRRQLDDIVRDHFDLIK